MKIRELYETLLTGNRVTLEFVNRAEFLSIYSQLRSVKSKTDAELKAISGDTISGGQVIRYENLPSTEDRFRVAIFLGEAVVRSTIKFQILDIEPTEES